MLHRKIYAIQKSRMLGDVSSADVKSVVDILSKMIEMFNFPFH